MKNIWTETTSVNKRMDGESSKIAYMLVNNWDALECYLDRLAEITVDEFINEESAPHLVNHKEALIQSASYQALKSITYADQESQLWNTAMLAILDTIQNWNE